MPIHCAWCGSHVGDDARLIEESHGICAACEQSMFPTHPKTAAGAAHDPNHPESGGSR